MTKFNFKKKFGQNFLQDKGTINNIAYSINPTEKDLIIEIGPGGGALTKVLKNFHSYLLCYEIDPEVDTYLSPLKDDKMNVIYDDFLKRDVLNDIKDIPYENLYIIGNLPYYITTPIITKIIDANLPVKEMVFMIQKEVADRFSAKPKSKEYGSITVFLNYFYDIKKLFIVSKNKFYPVPGVDSAVIKLTRKETIPVDFDKFNKLVKDAFFMKRKNLRNNLKAYDLDKMNGLLLEHGFDLTNRAEDLNYEVFVDIANKL